MLATFLLPALCAGALLAHPNSISSSRLSVAGAEVRHELVLQQEALREVVPDADLDGDERLDAAELAAAREQVVAYITRNYVLHEDEARTRPLEREVLRLELVEPPVDLRGLGTQWVRMDSTLSATAPIEVLAAEMTLFFHTSPDHRDFCEVLWDGERAFATTFSAFEPRAVFRTAELPFTPWWGWAREGALRFARSLERLAFLLALWIGAPRARSGVRLGAAYGAAQLAGYALAATGLVALPQRFLELSTALSCAFVGGQLLARREARALYLEASTFGALHGLAFGSAALSATRGLLLPAAPVAWLEVGQLTALAAAVLLGGAALWLTRRGPAPEPPRLGRPALVLAAGVTLFGLARFAWRAGWL